MVTMVIYLISYYLNFIIRIFLIHSKKYLMGKLSNHSFFRQSQKAEGFKEKSGDLVPALIIRSMNSKIDVARINHIPTPM
jgi:hypothetical protein